MKYPRSILVVLAALGLAAATAATAATAASPSPAAKPGAAGMVFAGAQPTLPVPGVKKGERGYGLSGFSGPEAERFDVEGGGGMRNLRPGISYIPARLTGKGLGKSGVA